MTVPIEHVLALSAGLFGIGVAGALLRRNLIVILMSIELMLSAASLAFVAFNRMWATSPGGGPAVDGHVFVLLVVVVAAAQVAVGLGILIALVRTHDSVNVEDVSLLKW